MNILLITSAYKSVANYMYMEDYDKNDNEINNRINNKNACNHLVHKLFCMYMNHGLLLQEHEFQVSENKVLTKIFGYIKDKVSEQFKILHEEFCDLCHLDCQYNDICVLNGLYK